MADQQPGRAPLRLFGNREPGETRLHRLERIGEAYVLVLFLVMTTFVVTITLPPHGWGGRVAAVAITATTAIVALSSSDVRIERLRLAVLAGAIAVGFAIAAQLAESNALLGVAFVIVSTLLATAVVTVLRRVILAAEVDFRTIIGSICVYTMLGLLFGNLFLALGRLKGNDVFTGVDTATVRDYMFFSYTTLTTTGYGNLVPKDDIGQILAVLEMLTGQIFLVTLVAGLVSLWRPGARPARADETPSP